MPKLASKPTRPRDLLKRVLLLGLEMGVLATGCAMMSQTMSQVATKFREGYQAQRSYEAGLDRYEAKDYGGAIAHFRQALSLEPDFDDAVAYLAWSYYHAGDHKEATRQFRRAIIRQPNWEGLYNGLGWSRYQVGRYHLALEAFQAALDRDPTYRDATVGFAFSLFELGRYAEALPHLTRLTREGERGVVQGPSRDPRDADAVRSRLAWTLFYLGKYEQARDEFSRGVAARPNWYGLHNGLAWTYLHLGDQKRARESFQRALRVKPDYAEALQGLALTGQ
jgi:Tfp pilus assembly protein PilF